MYVRAIIKLDMSQVAIFADYLASFPQEAGRDRRLPSHSQSHHRYITLSAAPRVTGNGSVSPVKLHENYLHLAYYVYEFILPLTRVWSWRFTRIPMNHAENMTAGKFFIA